MAVICGIARCRSLDYGPSPSCLPGGPDARIDRSQTSTYAFAPIIRRVKAFRIAAVTGVLGALTTGTACDSERILAIARDATGNPTDAGTGTDAGTFGSPQPVTGLRSDTDEVQDPSLTFEETEIYFVSPTGGQNDIWVSRRAVSTDPWGPSTLVAELSSPQNDEDPEVSVDGLVMYLTSDRGGDGRRLYATRRRTRDTPWEMPTRVDGLGTSAVDEAPALDRGQLYLVFGSQRGTATDLHLFAAVRPDASAAWQSAARSPRSAPPGRTPIQRCSRTVARCCSRRGA